MSLYSIYADLDHYLYIGFDWEQIVKEFGEDRSTRFDVDGSPTSYANIWKVPINISFGSDSPKGLLVPDISEHQGRLFLNEKAYDVLKDLIANDGEFLPVKYKGGTGYMFNPLQLAEKVNGLNTKLSMKNEWGEVANMAFHEERIKDFAIFRTEFDLYLSVFCQPAIKNAIEKSGLKGVIFTDNLGSPFSMNTSQAFSPTH